ncbi:MAG: phosphoribosylformimino-5-aminoimidazole carboxamide ribotide isomerase [Lachnospiraceae bacterium]|nr:phosphoribosylformimino-5-aminoimidazole carboxamide ribotide isomerase [Lachnospiraceae bacterium]
MQFRPCIDIHNGRVKQIVGSSLTDAGDQARENFVATQDAAYFAKLYQSRGLLGGHVILLNHKDSAYYEATRQQALLALSAYPSGLQVGGGIGVENAASFLKAGASHVVVTSYVFREGRIEFDRLNGLKQAVGKEHLVLDVSCRRFGDSYFVCTDRWQNKTDFALTEENLTMLSDYCDEFLIHAVDVEGKSRGIEESVAAILGSWAAGRPQFHEKITYAGGVGSFEDLKKLKQLGGGHVNVTIGSSLDLFGGDMAFDEVLAICKEEQ